MVTSESYVNRKRGKDGNQTKYIAEKKNPVFTCLITKGFSLEVLKHSLIFLIGSERKLKENVLKLN